MIKTLFRKLKRLGELLAIWLVVKIHNLFDFIYTVFFFYRKPQFAAADLWLLVHYILKSPFRISRKFLQKQGDEDIYRYGETPLKTFAKIAKCARITPHDIVFEVGSGRGRTCFWLRCFLGASTVGIEFIPDFVKIAGKVQKNLKIDRLEFRNENFIYTDFSNATVIYFYGTGFETGIIEKFITKLEQCKPGTRIITVSYPLTDYASKKKFHIMKSFPTRFTWGEADVYIHLKL